MSDEFDLKILCMGAGYVGGPTMAVIAKQCPKVRRLSEKEWRDAEGQTSGVLEGLWRQSREGFGRLITSEMSGAQKSSSRFSRSSLDKNRTKQIPMQYLGLPLHMRQSVMTLANTYI